MLKKLTSLLLSLLLCLSLMPGQTRAACEPDPAGSTVIEESLDPETPEEPVSWGRSSLKERRPGTASARRSRAAQPI